MGAKIETQKVQRAKYLYLFTNGHQWATGSAAKIKHKVIPYLKTKRLLHFKIYILEEPLNSIRSVFINQINYSKERDSINEKTV